jgi:hypothetical protein
LGRVFCSPFLLVCNLHLIFSTQHIYLIYCTCNGTLNYLHAWVAWLARLHPRVIKSWNASW